MKKLLSVTEIRWWFRSRKSDGHLNSLSYWLCVLVFSVTLSLILSALWQVYIAELGRLRSAAEEMDWVGDAPLNGLEAYRETFLGQRVNLINRVRYGDQSQGESALLLRPAADMKNENGSSPNPSSMFGNPDVRVYPSFATFAPKERGEGLTEAEKTVFNNFANAVTSLYKGQQNKDVAHVERSLTAALGLSGPDPSMSPFDVPWVYVASDEGAIAVFPGTHVIDEPSWKTSSRPWFRAALGGDAQLFTKGLMPEDLLTTTYQDVLAKQPMLVRTYMYKFQLAARNAQPSTPQEFVICIDIFRDARRAGAMAAPAAAPVNLGAAFVSPSSALQTLGLVHYVTFGLSILFFMALRWMTTKRDAGLTFERMQRLVGRLRGEDELRTQTEDLTTCENKVGVEFGRYAVGKVERSAQEKNNVSVHTRVEKSRIEQRGCELWQVSLGVSASWNICGLRFRSNRATLVGTLRLIYTSEELPKAEWISFNGRAFPEAKAAELYDGLPDLLERNADLCEGSLRVPEQGADTYAFLRAPDVPEWVRSAVEPKELLAVRQRRAYVRLTIERIGQLYSTAAVKAVMASGFFEELLNYSHYDVLLKGKTISRLISLPDEGVELNLHDGSWQTLAELMGSDFRGDARRLRRVSRPINDQSDPAPVYDFAILDERFVIVTHSVAKLVSIDGASGKTAKPTYVVEGYVSWRAADVEFYRDLFSELAEQAKTLGLPADKFEVINDEESDPFDIEPNWA